MTRHRIGVVAAGFAGVLLAVGFAGAAEVDPYTAPYCDPAPNTKLLYSSRAYLILPKAPDSPAFFFSYAILGTSKRVERFGQFLFDDGADEWDTKSSPEGLQLLWPLQPKKHLAIERKDRATGVHANVTFEVLGLEPIKYEDRLVRSWKIRRFDQMDNGTTALQFLWYAPELCTLTAFTDSQHRQVRLLHALKPGDANYDRPLERKKGRLYYTDSDEPVE